jgi:SpoVK/Ycf46/Vps4 family AAA+-type ATPase
MNTQEQVVNEESKGVNEEIYLLIKARYPIIYIVSWEEERVLNELSKICHRGGEKLIIWSYSSGFVDENNKPVGEGSITDPVNALNYVMRNAEDNRVYVFLDFHNFLRVNSRIDPAFIIRKLRDIARILPNTTSSLIILSPILELPMELEKDVTVIDYPLPDLKVLDSILSDIENKCKSNPNLTIDLQEKEREELLKACLGLTFSEVNNVISKALVKDGRLDASDIPLILEEKKQLTKKGGFLEYVDVNVGLDAVGGLDVLKQWFKERSLGFTEEARKFPLEVPKGVLLTGIPGCGKSMCAKAVAKDWRKPLLRFDIGSVFGKYLGESEFNMRRAIKIAEAMAPCVLWIDEIEKGFSGVQAGERDSGTAARVFGTFLTWMQDKKSEVFVFATANDISHLPPELLRKGRFDEIFFVDLPTIDEREEIFRYHLRKRQNRGTGRVLENFNIKLLAEKSEGYSGAEIEAAIESALYRVFFEHRELTDQDIIKSLEETKPISVTMKEKIQSLRAWAKDHARYASSKIRTDKGEVLDRWGSVKPLDNK